jgi:AmmeMemoRadiSam system protein B/AmmeMemoRadiSam system protein A
MGSDRSMNVRPAACAGTWYPGDPVVLSRMIDALLAAVPRSASRHPVRAIVVPHAGLRYSGPTAAAAYREIDAGAFDRAVVLAPSHRTPLRGAAVDPSRAYDTPLGPITLDDAAVQQLVASPPFQFSRDAFALEHAIEMQLPFLRTLLPDALLVPVLVGELRGGADELAATLEPLLDRRTLLVVSSDFTHYGDAFGYRPFTDDVPRRLAALDRRAIDAVIAGSGQALRQMLDETEATICGRNPLQVLLALPRSGWSAELMHYTTSGELTGDWEHCVSYASLVFRQRSSPRLDDVASARTPETAAEQPAAGTGVGAGFGLSAADRATLLHLARRTLRDLQAAAADPDAVLQEAAVPDHLCEPAGVFVSLHTKRSGRLRGCIGWVVPREPLARAVVLNTLGAAQRDPRFDPVQSTEADTLEIEISVLGPMRDVGDVEEIEIGRHGLMVTAGDQHAVLLPQVPTHFGWDRIAFLENVCRKADLPADAWQQGARLQSFEADVFSETTQAEDGGVG